MTNIVTLPSKLGAQAFCLCSDCGFQNIWQAWVPNAPEQALANPDFFSVLYPHVKAGDSIELFQVSDIQRPELDPLAMMSFAVISLDVDRHGSHVRVKPVGELLRFNGSATQGVSIEPWNGKWRVYEDGKRVASFLTSIEAADYARITLGAKLPPLPSPKQSSTLSSPADRALRIAPGDIAVAGTRKISRVVSVRTLAPIADVLSIGDFFAITRSSFLTADRVSFIRYSNDAYDQVIELLPLAIVDVLAGGGLRFYSRSEIQRYGEFEAGLRLTLHDGLHTIRQNGQTIERHSNQQLAQWRFDELKAVEMGRAS